MTPKTSGGYDCEYFIKDHLGNNRVTVWDSAGVAVVQQENHYYPFGMVMHGNSYQNENQENPNKYLYNGKEYIEDLGLNLYSYGAREYDHVLARWHIIAPKAEKYLSMSPINYVAGNPLKYIDPNGMEIDPIHLKQNTPEGYEKLKKDLSSVTGRQVTEKKGKLKYKRNILGIAKKAKDEFGRKIKGSKMQEKI